MSLKHIGSRSVQFAAPPSIAGSAAVCGPKEGQGPLRRDFDFICEDAYFGEASWEKAESALLKQCFHLACDKAKTPPSDIDYLLSGDLLNQCTGSAFAMRDSNIPFFGLYGACSTMAESLSLSAMLIDGGFADTVAAATGSHFCSAERQFRFPLEYGGQRTPTAQWTVTASGAFILQSAGIGPFITHVTTGKIVDAGITDANNMGAAMAPAACDTLCTHFRDLGRSPADYDLIVTGDLGKLGHSILVDLMAQEGFDLRNNSNDCGMMIFYPDAQDVHSGGSGCGCSASVLAGHLMREFAAGHIKRLLFAATGALMSTTTSQQGESIPGICHAVAIDAERGC